MGSGKVLGVLVGFLVGISSSSSVGSGVLIISTGRGVAVASIFVGVGSTLIDAGVADNPGILVAVNPISGEGSTGETARDGVAVCVEVSNWSAST